ncbi:NADPH-dependent diflavin oxidoreductase 1 [Durusdinium trenchii]
MTRLGRLRATSAPEGTAREVNRKKQQDYLKNFLRANDFPTVHSSRAAAFQGVEEMVYPIHGAAILGCPRLLRLILLAGGDPLQATEPSGRRPIDLAREVNREGSHDEVLELLSSEVKVLHLRDAMALMRQTTPETPKSTRRCRSTRVSL